jgi:hypothetical protein
MNRDIYRQLKEERGVDIRFPATAILGVSSIDRYNSPLDEFENPTSPYRFSLNSKQNFLNGFFTRLALTEIKFPWGLPTITNKNSKIYINYRVGGNPGFQYKFLIDVFTPIAALTGGWATPADIATEIENQVQAPNIPQGWPGAPAFTMVVQDSDGAFFAESNNADTFYFEPYVDDQYPLRTTLYQMMNWYGKTWGTTQYSGPPTMLWTQFVDIVCSQLTYNQDLKDADTGPVSRDILARIYLTPSVDNSVKDPFDVPQSVLVGSQPFEIYRDFNTPKQIRWSHNQPVGNLTFEVYDDSGEILNDGITANDPSHPDWNFTLLVTEQ